MAGIAGTVSASLREPQRTLDRMAESLCVKPGLAHECWHDDRAGFCRVHVGANDPVPQPIFNSDGSKCIVFFGECYDYVTHKQDLIRQGSTFRFADNDAEFCLALYSAYGIDGLSLLSGSYCFAIYDKVRHELVLVSDRLATRPLFYGAAADGQFYFATQVNAVLSASAVCRQLDLSAVVEFCTLQRVLGTKTHHKGVRMLPPGSVLRYSAGAESITRYWKPQYRPQPGTADEYAEELAQVMRRSARHLSRGNVRPAMLLSGGLDSRMLVAAADCELVCYTFADYFNPEARTARSIAEARGFEFRFLRREPDHYVSMVDRGVELGSGMYAFNHAHALGFVEQIADSYKVVTHGFVPELLFRGTTLPKVAKSLFGISIGKELDPTLNEASLTERLFRRKYSLLDLGARDLFVPEVRAVLDETLRATSRELIVEAAEHSENIYDQFLWPDVNYHVRYPSMLFETSLRSFMTERSIYFNNEAIDLHLRMPVAVRSSSRVWIKAVERLNGKIARVVDANTGSSPYFSEPVGHLVHGGKKRLRRVARACGLDGRSELAERDAARRGLSDISWPLFDVMLRNNVQLRQLVQATLKDLLALPPHIFDLAKVEAMLAEHMAGHANHRNILFVLLTFGRWHKKYGC
jgi:asparagine synthase (glutamine-hydrolysing)